MRLVVSAAVLAALATPVLAQDLERPWLDPDAVDIDEEAETKSLFWERAIYPHRQLYDSRVKRAIAYLEKGDDEAIAEAEALLRGAIRLAPDDPRSHWYLSAVEFESGNWKECAELRATVARLDPEFSPKAMSGNRGGTANVDLGLGQCLSLSGDYEGALRRYKSMLSRGEFVAASSFEVRWRMGEAYMALGRLEEAIASLKEARRLNPREYVVYYALATAYDRNEQIAATRDILLEIAMRDRSLTTLSRDGLHIAPPEDEHYYRALAETLVPVPSRSRGTRRGSGSSDRRAAALARFRMFVSLHGNGPWARRARHHIDVLSREPLTAANIVQYGGAQFDEAKAIAAVERANDALQACVEATPGVVYQVEITALTKAAKPKPAPARTRRPPVPVLRGGGGSSGPAAGVRTRHTVIVATKEDAIAAAASCLDTEADKLGLPAPTGPAGDSVTLEFQVVSQSP